MVVQKKKTSPSISPTIKQKKHVEERENLAAVENEDDFPTAELLRRANDEYYTSHKARNKENKYENGLPIPVPARKRKEEVFRIENYEELDRKACDAPRELLDSPLNELVDYLVEETRTELERVRVLFRWITAQNPAQENSTSDGTVFVNPLTPREHLIGIATETVTYHKLMTAMCGCVGIKTQAVRGFTKHSKYEPGDELPSGDSDSSWTAVLIDDEWYLMDVHWASKQVTGEEHSQWELIDDNGRGRPQQSRAKTRQIQYSYDETYFLTSPEQFIFSHFPKDPRWQLLARPVSADEFVKMAYVKGSFFRYSLRMDSHKKCVVKAEDGEITISLSLPVAAKYSFIYRLWMSNQGGGKSDAHKNAALKRFALMQINDGLLKCNVKFPSAGKFKLEVSCTDKSIMEKTYSFVCAHVIVVDKPKAKIKPYPENSRCEWGPGYDLEQVGMYPLTHKEGLVNVQNGETELRFSAEKDIAFSAKVHSNNKSHEDMTKFIFYRIEEDKVIVNVKFPEAGDYALNMFAREKGADDDGTGLLSNVCSYLLSSSEPASDLTPFAASGKLGASDMLNTLGVKPISHPSAYIQLPKDGHADFRFSTPPDRQFLANLDYYDGSRMENMNEFTMIDKSIDGVTFHTRFPKKGQYKLSLYGKDKNVDGNLPHLFTYLIIVQQPMNPCLPFPTVYSQWTDDCKMIKPDLGSALYPEQTVPVAVRIPTAHNVAFIANGKWTQLIQDGSDSGLWTGELFTGSVGDAIKLSACFDESDTSYSTLLLFKVVAMTKNADNKQTARKLRSKTKPITVRQTKTTAISQRPKKNKEIELVEQWKAKFLADEERKQMGEKEYRRRKAVERKDTLNGLAKTAATLR